MKIKKILKQFLWYINNANRDLFIQQTFMEYDLSFDWRTEVLHRFKCICFIENRKQQNF